MLRNVVTTGDHGRSGWKWAGLVHVWGAVGAMVKAENRKTVAFLLDSLNNCIFGWTGPEAYCVAGTRIVMNLGTYSTLVSI